MGESGAHPLGPAGPRQTTAHWEALGTSAVLRVTDPAALPAARTIVQRELDAIDRACSRFRDDSDLSRVNAAAGRRPVRVAPLLIEALDVALRAARLTGGDVDPTVGAALVLAGYDRDWRLLDPPAGGPGGIAHAPGTARERSGIFAEPRLTVRATVRRGCATIELDRTDATVRIPRGVILDLGATAKAWAADRAARAVWEVCGGGVLVSLGGDIATAGPAPAGGWRVHVTDDHRAGPDAPGQRLTICGGGLATSSTAVRRWRSDGSTMHHIIDPATGAPTLGPWRTVSVAAADCADANIASTAALVRGDGAAEWLAQMGLPARLVDHRGAVLTVAGWPEGRTTVGPSQTPAGPPQAPANPLPEAA
jgi:FAD:protein FMN transferase